MHVQRDPTVLPDVRRAKESGVFEEDTLQQRSNFQADPELALILLEHGKHFSFDAKRGVPKADSLGCRGQAQANRPQFFQHRLFRKHAQMISTFFPRARRVGK